MIARQTVPLASVAHINPTLNAVDIEAGELVDFVPMAAVEADVSVTESLEVRPYEEVKKGYTSFADGDVLLAKITPCFENGKISQIRTRSVAGFGSTEFHVIRPRPDMLDARYLVHLLRQDKIRTEGERRMTGSAGQRRVPKSFLESLPVFLPSLPEQRRIAAILDKADALRAKRREALAQLDRLAQSMFVEMFGSESSHSWDMTTVSEMALPDSGMRTGPFGSQLLHSEFTDDGVAVLGIDNAVANEFCWGERRFITERKYQELKRYTVKPGDVLITIMGTCGRCAVVPEDIPLAINTKHLCCISTDRQKCLPDFLHAYFLRHPVARKYLEQTAKGAIMSGLNMGIIKAMPIPLVPLDLQQEFVERQQALRAVKTSHQNAQIELNTMFASLQHRAFRGEL